jgi:hypothetical protein
MRTGSVVVMCSALAGFWGAAPLALAQQKTEKACQAEWDANKAIFQPKGITEQEYVDECRDFRAAPAAPAAAPKEAAHGAAPLAPSLLISQYLCIIGCFCGPVCWLLCRRTTLLREETREAVGFF